MELGWAVHWTLRLILDTLGRGAGGEGGQMETAANNLSYEQGKRKKP